MIVSIPTYADFDLLIDRSPAGYRARVLRSPAGEASVEFALPFTADELANFLGRTAGGGHVLGAISGEAGLALDPRTFGTRLYAAVFAGPVGLCLRRSLDEAERRGVGLRIRLRIDAGVLDLAALPWEFLFAPDLDRFLRPIRSDTHRPLRRAGSTRPAPARSPAAHRLRRPLQPQ